MKPNSDQQGNKPVEVIDTEGENPTQEEKHPATPEHFYIGPERQQLEAEFQNLDQQWRSTQLIKLFTKVGKDIALMDPEVRANLSDEEIKQVKLVIYRTTANLTIGLLDVIPAGIGEMASWGADTLKVAKSVFIAIKKRTKKIRKKFPSWLDLTPDVPNSVAVLSEVVEPFTGGWAPTHLLVEFPMQLHHDINRVIEFLKKVERIKAYIRDYRSQSGTVPADPEQENVHEKAYEKPSGESEEQRLIREIEEIFGQEKPAPRNQSNNE